MDKIIEQLKLIQDRKEYGELLIKYEAGTFTICKKTKTILLAKKKEA